MVMVAVVVVSVQRFCLENEAQGANQCEWKWTLGRPIVSYVRPTAGCW